MPFSCPIKECGELFQNKNHLSEHLEFVHRLSSQQNSNFRFLVAKINKFGCGAMQDLDGIDAHMRDEFKLCNKIPQNSVPISNLEYEVAAATIGDKFRKFNNPGNRRVIRTKFNQPLYRRIVEKAIVQYNPFRLFSFPNEYNTKFGTLDEQYSGSDSESQSFMDTEGCYKPSERIPQNTRANYFELQTRDQQAADLAAHCDLRGCNCSSRRISDKSDVDYGISSNSNNFLGDSGKTIRGHSNVMLRPENFQQLQRSMSYISQDKIDASIHVERHLDQASRQYSDKCSICETGECDYVSSETCHNDSKLDENEQLAENSSSSFAKTKIKYHDMIIDAIVASKNKQSTIS
ncbi:MAG: hypothetical protein MHMPM18_003144, partial [Marteilia pararefringens]